MDLNVAKGKYVLAVSGGVDSMTLLHLLVQKQKAECRMQNAEEYEPGPSFPIPHSPFCLVVAHFNHGIRAEANGDEEFVRRESKRLSLEFVAGHGRLGAGASEETARQARYKFLKEIQKRYRADGIITAHHQDDLIETAFLNLLRGTGYRGLVAISTNPNIIRPLLSYPKKDLIDYAQRHHLKWREDATNQDESYLRNYIRKYVIANMSAAQRRAVLKNIRQACDIHQVFDQQIAKLSQNIQEGSLIKRGRFANLPLNLGNELIVYWLRQKDTPDFDKRTIERLNLALRTAKPGTTHPVKADLQLKIGAKTARFTQQV